MTTRTALVTLMLFVASAGASHATTASYECSGGTRLIANFSPPGANPGRVLLRMVGAQRQITLPQVMSADGGRYANDRMEFWIKGRSATLTREGRSETCHTQ